MPAKDVRVLLLRLEEPDSAGVFQISWEAEAPLEWSHRLSQPLTQTIGPAHDVKLCCVVKNPLAFKLSPLFRSLSLKADWDSACKIAVIVQARAIEGDSSALRVITWDGQWSDDSIVMRKHLVVRAKHLFESAKLLSRTSLFHVARADVVGPLEQLPHRGLQSFE